MNVLSIHYGHDSSACILKDGEVVLYFKEERLSGIKRDALPFHSIKECIENFDGNMNNIDEVVFTSTEYNYFTVRSIYIFISTFLPKEKKHSFKFTNYTHFHHLTHVGTSFFNSGFDESLVVVVDGRGSDYNGQVSECESVYYASHNTKDIKPIIKNYFVPSYMNVDQIEDNIEDGIYREHFNGDRNVDVKISRKIGGIVNLYTTATLLIGQKLEEGGKVMGLSSYGSKIENFPRIFKDNITEVDESYFVNENINNEYYYPTFKGCKEKITKDITKENYKFYADYAYEVQTQTQEAVGNLIEKAIQKTGLKKVCISGGYGMNIVANHYYLQRFPDVEFYFEPIADDTGGAIGLGKILHFFQNKEIDRTPLKTTSFHGIKHDISKYRGITNTTNEIASLLFEDKSVAVYTGLSEVGQRALGNRSIFFNALNPNAREIINETKKREWYRPFAAIVLEEDANIYFDMGRIKSSPFMTICFPVREEYTKIIPGVTHVDNTCRVQTVSENDGYLYELLCEFKKLSGHGILLNTSFNLAGEPLVETPEDAFKTLKNSTLDYLWFEETNQLFTNAKL